MSEFKDLDRPPLRESELRRSLLRPGSIWTTIEVLPEVGSTNVELATRARAGAPEGTVLIAERQTAGRGRLDRQWESPARAGIALSLLVRPTAPMARYSWLPLLAGVALVEAVGVGGLKWPNDLLIEGRKCAGILAEVCPAEPLRGSPSVGRGEAAGGAVGGVVIGIGLNVSLRADELPRPDATSLVLAGAPLTDRGPLVKALLRAFETRYTAWNDAGGDPVASRLLAEYSEKCVTLGQTVRAELPGGRSLTGTAAEIDRDGRLVLEHDGGRIPVAAGDVVHVRT